MSGEKHQDIQEEQPREIKAAPPQDNSSEQHSAVHPERMTEKDRKRNAEKKTLGAQIKSALAQLFLYNWPFKLLALVISLLP